MVFQVLLDIQNQRHIAVAANRWKTNQFLQNFLGRCQNKSWDKESSIVDKFIMFSEAMGPFMDIIAQ